MSVRAAIHSVKVQGVPVYLGMRSGTDSFSANPDTVMNWMCDGWRTRFNQHRSKRQKYVKATLPDGESRRVLIVAFVVLRPGRSGSCRPNGWNSSAGQSYAIDSHPAEETAWYNVAKMWR